MGILKQIVRADFEIFSVVAIIYVPKMSTRDTSHSLRGPFSKYIGFTLKKNTDPQQKWYNFWNTAQNDPQQPENDY